MGRFIITGKDQNKVAKNDRIQFNDYWDIPVVYHPTHTGKIIINIPGAGGSINGFKDKYYNWGNHIQKNGLASFVRIPNERPQDFILTARVVINYCLENALEICGVKEPEIWMIGFSAGGASVLFSAWEYPEITKALVINPFLNLDKLRVEATKDLPLFEGELSVYIGKEDSVISPDTGEFIKEYASKVSQLSINYIDGCDHQLKGEKSSKFLSGLPFKCFANQEIEGIDLLNH